MESELLGKIQAAVTRGAYRLTTHAVKEATADDLTIAEVRDAIISPRAEILENYLDDPRGSSCLVLSWTADERPIHIVVSHPPDVAVITVYTPGANRWVDPRTRRSR